MSSLPLLVQYGKSEKPFMLPSIIEGDEVLIPKKDLEHVLYAKESQLSFKAHLFELFQIRYTVLPGYYDAYDYVVKLIRQDLTKLLESPSVAAALSNEARSCLADIWGKDTDRWVDVPLNSTIEKMTARLINVLAIGPENC